MSQIAEAAPVIDAFVDPKEYEAWLNDVRSWLPAFLSAGAGEQPDPAGDVQELMRLEPEDLRRVQAVHLCLSEEVRAFVQALPAGLRRPITSSVRPRQIAQIVRGPIDWGATTRVRASAGANPALFVTRPGRRVFDTEENQALVWALGRLSVAVRAALAGAAETPETYEAKGWMGELLELRSGLRLAHRAEWLRNVEPKRPTPFTRQRLAVARTVFYRQAVGGVVTRLLACETADPKAIAETISQRYFVPDRVWKLFEIWVALRLARELDKPEHSEGMRKVRLLAGANVGRGTGFARFKLHSGDEVRLIYQGWPASPGASVRQATAARHNFRPASSIPDLMVVRKGQQPDVVVIELKASRQPGTLAGGLSQLLGYLNERPDLFGAAPAGWLVAPKSATFDAVPATPGEPLWIVDADEIPAAVADRFAG